MRRLLLLVPLCACSAPPAPRLSAIQAKIFNVSCTFASCHPAGQAPEILDLSEGHAFRSLYRQPAMWPQARQDGLLRVYPGRPGVSFLVMKLAGHLPPQYGACMPLNNCPFDAGDLEAIEDWIRRGAPND